MENHNLQNLLLRLAAGEHLEYLLFWGHTSKNEAVSAVCFSQWWQQKFEVEGIVYPTAEHWMMAKKAVLFDDNETLAEILAAEKPADVKALGRKVRNFVPEVWEKHCFEIVVAGNYHKFVQNADLKAFLLSTGTKILVEASPFDAIWGIGMGETHKDARNPLNWRGTNLLGFALMEVRDKLA